MAIIDSASDVVPKVAVPKVMLPKVAVQKYTVLTGS